MEDVVLSIYPPLTRPGSGGMIASVVSVSGEYKWVGSLAKDLNYFKVGRGFFARIPVAT